MSQTPKNMLELRKFASSRISASLTVSLQQPFEEKYQSLNVSHHGMLIQGPKNLEVGDLVKFKTSLPPHKKIVPVIARVVRSTAQEDGSFACALQFLEMHAQAYIYWLEYIYKIEMIDAQSSMSSATRIILDERKKLTYNIRKIQVVFDTEKQAQQFILEKIRDHKIFLNLSTLKIPGDVLILSFFISETQQSTLIKTKILESQEASFKPDWAVKGLPLSIHESEEDFKLKIDQLFQSN